MTIAGMELPYWLPTLMAVRNATAWMASMWNVNGIASPYDRVSPTPGSAPTMTPAVKPASTSSQSVTAPCAGSNMSDEPLTRALMTASTSQGLRWWVVGRWSVSERDR
jgi:hypothetical protein